jgi:hypothetical protein
MTLGRGCWPRAHLFIPSISSYNATTVMSDRSSPPSPQKGGPDAEHRAGPFQESEGYVPPTLTPLGTLPQKTGMPASPTSNPSLPGDPV